MSNKELKDYPQIAGIQIKKARKARGYERQEQLAIAMTGNPNASATIISRIETGKNVEFWRYIKAAHILQVPLWYIFRKDEPLPSEPYIDHLTLDERLTHELESIGKLVRASRKAQGKVLGDFEKGVGVGLDPSNVSKLERGEVNAKLYTIVSALSEVNKTMEDAVTGD